MDVSGGIAVLCCANAAVWSPLLLLKTGSTGTSIIIDCSSRAIFARPQTLVPGKMKCAAGRSTEWWSCGVPAVWMVDTLFDGAVVKVITINAGDILF